MERPVSPAERCHADSYEIGEQSADVLRREHVQVREIPLGLKPTEEAQPVLHPERVGHRADEDATRPEDAAHLGNERTREAHVLEQLARDDRIEGLAVQRERLVDVGYDRRDPELLGFGQRSLVDVDADDGIALEEVAGERARATAEIENVPTLADRLLKERNPLGDEDEIPVVSALTVMRFV